MEDTTIEDVLKTFEGYYAQGDYPNALLTLEKASEKLPATLVHYNFGVVYGKMKDWSAARYHFLMASREGMSSVELNTNLSLSESELGTVKLEKAYAASDYFIKIGLWSSQGFLTTLSLLILVLALFSFKKVMTLKKVAGSLILILIPLALNWWIQSWPLAVVARNQTLQDGPSAIFNTSGEIPAGVMVLLREKGEWAEVLYPSRFQGWIKSSSTYKLE